MARDSLDNVAFVEVDNFVEVARVVTTVVGAAVVEVLEI